MQKREVSWSAWRILVVGIGVCLVGAAAREPVLGQETARPPKSADEKKDVVEAKPRVFPWEHEMAISVAFSPDGKLLAVGSNQELVALCDPVSLKVKSLLKGHSLPRINDLMFSPDGTTLAAANGDFHGQKKPADIWIWDVRGEKVRFKLSGHNGQVWSVAFTPDGKSIISCATDEKVTIWDAATGEETATLVGHQGAVRRVAISPDGKMLATGGFDGTIELWDLSPLKARRSFPAHQRGVNALTFSPDGKTLASSARFPSDDGVAASLWDVAAISLPLGAVEPKSRKDITEVRGRILAIAFSPNGKLMATGGGTYGQFGELKFWNPVDGHLVEEKELPKSIDSLAFSPDSTTLVTAAGVEKVNGDLLLWKVATPKPK